MNVLAALMTALQTPPQSSSVDLVAIAGIAGTLIGTALGSFVTWKIQMLQLAHEDRTRFHERRLSVYADFTGATNQVAASMNAGTAINVSAMVKEVDSYNLLRLVATTAVKSAADSVHNVLMQVEQAGRPTPDALAQEFNSQIYNFISKARDEIGVNKLG